MCDSCKKTNTAIYWEGNKLPPFPPRESRKGVSMSFIDRSFWLRNGLNIKMKWRPRDWRWAMPFKPHKGPFGDPTMTCEWAARFWFIDLQYWKIERIQAGQIISTTPEKKGAKNG